MARKPIEIMKLKQIIQLKDQGTSNREISDILSIHRNTVNKYVRLIAASGHSLQALREMDDAGLERLFPTTDTVDDDRYEVLSPYFPYFAGELKKTGCTKLVLWKWYISRHPGGYGTSQFNEHLNNWLRHTRASGKINHRYGEKMLVDYTGKKLTVVDRATGEITDVEVFVAILPASHYMFAQASATQQKHDFISSINDALFFFGGVPKVIVPDNLKSAVDKASKYEPILNRTFRHQGEHYGFAINPTRSHRPRDKALVEGAVKLVYQRIFYPLSKQTFFGLADLNAAISERLKALNLHHMKTYDSSRFRLFNTYERPLLSPLPDERYTVREYKRAKVQKMGYVYLSDDRNYYSVPFRYIGKQVEIQYCSDTVEVFCGQQRIAAHKRNYRKGHYTTIEEHLASSHRFYTQWRPEYFLEQANDIGEHVYRFVSALLADAKYPEIAYKSALGVIHLKSRYDRTRIDNACRIAVENGLVRYMNIKNILQNGADLKPGRASRPNIPDHGNIRGNYS